MDRQCQSAAASPRRDRPHRCTPTPNAFTLLELLVVVGIIAILAGLLLPALGQAKARARTIQCFSEMKQWTLGFLEYPEDHQGWMPREGYHMDAEVYANNWAQVRDPQSDDVWYNDLAEYVSKPPAKSYARPEQVQGFYRSESFFQCPSVRLPSETRWPAYRVAIFSRAMNSQLIQDPIEFPRAKVPFARIRRPSMTVLFLDSLVKGEVPVVPEQAHDEDRGQPSAQANRFAGRRHRNQGNLSFADGHVETVPGSRVVDTEPGMNRGWAVQPGNILWELDP